MGDVFAINAPGILNEVDFEVCIIGRNVEMVFLSGCSMVGADFIAVWTEFGKVRP